MHAFRPLTEPPGPSRPVLADRRALPAGVVLDGVRPASPQLLWVVVDLGVAVLVAAAGAGVAVLADAPVVALAALGFLAALVVIAVDLLRTGRTPGHRILGVRTVDAATGLPAGARRLGSTRTLDVRRGHDPVRIVPHGTERLPVLSDQWQLTASRALNAPIVLTLDNGMAFSLVEPTVIGRNPARVEPASQLLQIPDLSRTMSKSHALLEPQGGMLWVTDLGSMNGTAVAVDGGPLEPLAPHVRTVVRTGATIELGDRIATVGTSARPQSPATTTSAAPGPREG